MRTLTRRELLAIAGGLAVGWLPGNSRAVAAVKWVDRQSYGPFQCAATFPIAKLDPAFRELAHLENELQRTLGLPRVKTPIDVLLFSSQGQHREFLARRYPRVPYRRALFVQTGDRGAVYAYRHAELPVDLRHECTHALLHANLAMVPLWLDEGLAEYFEMPPGHRAFQHPHLKSLRWKLRLGMVSNVESLEAARSLHDMGANEYRFAWAWAHYMLHGPEAAHHALVYFLADIYRGNPPGQLSTRLRQAVPDLETSMVQHFKHWRR